MKQGLTDIIVVLDRSGSMAGIRKDMEGGFDAFIAEQRKEPGDARVTLTQFDTTYEIVYDGKPLTDVPPLSLEPRGMTALYDAVGRTIAATGARFAALPEDERPERVLFVIITDGAENSSREFEGARVAAMVKEQTDKYSWQFVYIGANQDAVANAAAMNIHVASNFAADSEGSRKALSDLNIGTRSYRGGGGYQH